MIVRRHHGLIQGNDVDVMVSVSYKEGYGAAVNTQNWGPITFQ